MSAITDSMIDEEINAQKTMRKGIFNVTSMACANAIYLRMTPAPPIEELRRAIARLDVRISKMRKETEAV